jgi:hypothetical protein
MLHNALIVPKNLIRCIDGSIIVKIVGIYFARGIHYFRDD